MISPLTAVDTSQLTPLCPAFQRSQLCQVSFTAAFVHVRLRFKKLEEVILALAICRPQRARDDSTSVKRL